MSFDQDFEPKFRFFTKISILRTSIKILQQNSSKNRFLHKQKCTATVLRHPILNSDLERVHYFDLSSKRRLTVFDILQSSFEIRDLDYYLIRRVEPEYYFIHFQNY